MAEGSVKPGYKTTEFWGKLVLQAIVVLNMFAPEGSGREISPETGAAIVAGLEGLYGVIRAWVKRPTA